MISVTNVYVKETKDRGKGVFAKQDIKEGEIVGICEGKIYQEKDIVSSGLPDDHFMQIGWHKFMFVEPPIGNTNHSCEPNCGIKELIKLIALKDIKKDEEITLDYDTYEYDWVMKCKCGSENCRKTIRGYKSLPVELKKKYKGYISEYLSSPKPGDIL